jgi:molybdenum cofactor biosynthesis enzyme MoaA
MKQMKKLLLGLFLNLSFISSISATSQFAFTCPNKFIATVTNVEDLQSVGFAKVEVNFQVIQKIKGDSFESKKIQVVKDGPVDFKTGETYTVETRDNWLCNASVLSKI